MADLQGRLGAHAQFLPLDAPLPHQATLGGVLATKLSGPLRSRYGTARDLVLGMRVAHADGTVTKAGAKVVKNATGYDVTKLYLGSHGTLGVIVEATFRVYPRPEAEQGWWLPSADLETGQATANRILGSHLVPDRVELLDASAVRRCAASHDGPALLVSISGLRESVQGQAADLARIGSEFGIRPAPIANPDRVWGSLRDFPWASGDAGEDDQHLLWRAGVQPTDCARTIRAIHDAVIPGAVEAGIAGTVAHGVLRGTFRAKTSQGLAHSVRAAREALLRLGGYLTLLKAPGSVREQMDVWGITPDGLDVMRRMKSAFDAKGILNPGRYVGGI
jgi:glycolate oxidase FAD binding subunit